MILPMEELPHTRGSHKFLEPQTSEFLKVWNFSLRRLYLCDNGSTADVGVFGRVKRCETV